MSINLENHELERVNAAVPNDTLNQLTRGCLGCLDQCDELLSLLSEESYADASQSASSVGRHMRHIFDRFHCFFNGLAAAKINYDERKRDKEVENNLQAARFTSQSLRRRLDDLKLKDVNTLMIEEAVCVDFGPIPVTSTPERELMGLVSHSTHHLAIIAMIVNRLGISTEADFGKAASTLRYEQK